MFDTAVNILNILQPVAIILGGGFAIYTYRKDTAVKRADWLFQLFEKFFEDSRYKRIRMIIDYEDETKLKELKAHTEENKGTELHEEFVDYLNFFEFIMNQIKLGNLKEKEVYMVFEYYIKRLADFPFIITYAEREGFEGLSEFFTKLDR